MSDEGGKGGKLLSIVPMPPTPCTIGKLEMLLEMAKRGEILAFAYAADLTGGQTIACHAFEKGGSMSGLVLALERTKLRLLMKDE